MRNSARKRIILFKIMNKKSRTCTKVWFETAIGDVWTKDLAKFPCEAEVIDHRYRSLDQLTDPTASTFDIGKLYDASSAKNAKPWGKRCTYCVQKMYLSMAQH